MLPSLEFEAVKESPNAIDADQMSHKGIENRHRRSLVIVSAFMRSRACPP